jgi:hypothetical protein
MAATRRRVGNDEVTPQFSVGGRALHERSGNNSQPFAYSSAGSYLFAAVEGQRRIPMKTAIQHYSSYLPLLVVVLPAAIFGLYVAHLVVPEVVRVVVPAVVEKVAESF